MVASVSNTDMFFTIRILISLLSFINPSQIRRLTLSIRDHEEDFFGTERCLRCIDRGMRKQVMENSRRVKKGEVKGGTWVFQPVYPRVVDKLNQLLGSYNASSVKKKL